MSNDFGILQLSLKPNLNDVRPNVMLTLNGDHKRATTLKTERKLLRNSIIDRDLKSELSSSIVPDGKLELNWEYNNEAIETSQAIEGKYLLYATDPNLSHREVVREYMEKDFIEKTFRDLKSEVDMMPVRHRLEPRGRAYFFTISVAHRIRTALRYYIAEIPEKERNYDMDELLHVLRRVEFVQFTEEGEIAYWYLNLLKKTVNQVGAMGFNDLFEERMHSEL